MTPRNNTYLVYFLLLVAVVVMVSMAIQNQAVTPIPLTINQLAADIQDGSVSRIVVDENHLTAIYADGNEKTTNKEPETSLIDQLSKYGVPVEALTSKDLAIEIKLPSIWANIASSLWYLLPMVALVFVFWFIFRQAQGSNNAAMAFGKTRARMFSGEHPTVTFEDVAGVEESKQELAEVVEFLKEPQKFIQLGARIPKGVLLVGPPGTGKTLLAKAVSGEAGVPFFSISGSEFVEMFVGVGASRVRDLFDQAKRHSPCIVFVDEIDAVGRQRGAGLGGSHDEREQTLNQMLVEMDGFDTDTNVIIIAATNRPDILDPGAAAARPIRPPRYPGSAGREGPRGHPEGAREGQALDPAVDLASLARARQALSAPTWRTWSMKAPSWRPGATRRSIGQPELEEAIERVVMGPERKTRLISDEEKRIIAYHEAGHAVVANAIPEADPVQKVTIVGRGRRGVYLVPT